MLADAWATALMVLGQERAMAVAHAAGIGGIFHPAAGRRVAAAATRPAFAAYLENGDNDRQWDPVDSGERRCPYFLVSLLGYLPGHGGHGGGGHQWAARPSRAPVVAWVPWVSIPPAKYAGVTQSAAMKRPATARWAKKIPSCTTGLTNPQTSSFRAPAVSSRGGSIRHYAPFIGTALQLQSQAQSLYLGHCHGIHAGHGAGRGQPDHGAGHHERLRRGTAQSDTVPGTPRLRRQRRGRYPGLAGAAGHPGIPARGCGGVALHQRQGDPDQPQQPARRSPDRH